MRKSMPSLLSQIIFFLGLSMTWIGCSEHSKSEVSIPVFDATQVTEEIKAAVWAFHAADTLRDAEAVLDLLWPEYTMLADGSRLTYADVESGSKKFMASLKLFHTEWTDLEIIPLSRNIAVSSFLFRDSLITSSGDIIRSKGPTTFVWERRDGAWRVRFADADHYPID